MARQWQQWQQWQWWGGDTWSWTTSRSWQDSASRRHAVGVYFGTFDPIHENHIGLCKYALTQGVVQMVYLVVNGDNPMKPLAVSYEERLRLVRRRVELEVDDRIRLMELSGEEAGRMRWLDRQDICERARYLVEAGGNAEVYQLLGQDSFEQAVGRSRPKGKGKGKGIFSTSTRFLVFPRAGSDESVHIPPDMRRRVAVVKDYVDPVTLSSTQIRAAAAEGHDLQGSVHPGILEDVIATYTRTRRFLVLLFGPPGSGKTALGRELERAFGFYHISGGDAYRAAKSRGLFGAYREDDRKQTVAKVFAAVARAAAVLAPAPVSFDGFLPKELPDFEAKVGTPGLIIKLDCPAEVLQQRLQERGQREHDVDLSVSQRMRSHYSQDKALPEFHQCLRVLRSDRPLQDVAGDLAGLVREARQRKRLSGKALMKGKKLPFDDQVLEYLLKVAPASDNAELLELMADFCPRWPVHERAALAGHLKKEGRDLRPSDLGAALLGDSQPAVSSRGGASAAPATATARDGDMLAADLLLAQMLQEEEDAKAALNQPQSTAKKGKKKDYKPLNINYTVARAGAAAAPAFGTQAPSSLADLLRHKRSQQVLDTGPPPWAPGQPGPGGPGGPGAPGGLTWAERAQLANSQAPEVAAAPVVPMVKVRLRTSGGAEHLVEALSDETVGDVKLRLEKTVGFPFGRQQIMAMGRTQELMDHEPLQGFIAAGQCTFQLQLRSPNLSVRLQLPNRSSLATLPEQVTGQGLKEYIEKEHGIRKDHISLSFFGHPLRDQMSLADQ
ncbi:unnamed protein product, partial [Effrenium voratum]